MNMKKNIILSMLMIAMMPLLLGCNDDDNNNSKPTNKGIDPVFNIVNTTIGAEGGKFTIAQTNDSPWAIWGVAAEPNDNEADEYCRENPPIGLKGYKKVVGSWFAVERTNDKTIEVEIGKNETNQTRKIYIATFNNEDFKGHATIEIYQDK